MTTLFQSSRDLSQQWLLLLLYKMFDFIFKLQDSATAVVYQSSRSLTSTHSFFCLQLCRLHRSLSNRFTTRISSRLPPLRFPQAMRPNHQQHNHIYLASFWVTTARSPHLQSDDLSPPPQGCCRRVDTKVVRLLR